MGLRVREGGGSQGRPVMGRIGVEPQGNITPRESEQTSAWCPVTREHGKPTKETGQMTANPATLVDETIADMEAGAVSHGKDGWRQIDWQRVRHNVRRLQARIVKAAQEGRWGKVRALQHLLTHSSSAKALAVRRVTENQGSATPGVDKLLWDTAEKKVDAVRSLRQRGYRPQPLKRVYIPKSSGKMRPLGIPTMRDRAMQALYLLALDPIAEITADRNSYGFGPSDPPPMPSPSASSHSARGIRLSGSSRATSSPASTGSATTGLRPTSPWTGPCSRSG